MTRALSENAIEKELGRHTWSIQRQEFTPGAFGWHTPDIDDVDDTPELENGWAQPSLPLEKFSYRLHTDGSLEFKGHLDASAASSGTVAITLPDETYDPDGQELEPDYRPSRDQYFNTTITPDDGATFSLALVFIDATTGEVTITWPAS